MKMRNGAATRKIRLDSPHRASLLVYDAVNTDLLKKTVLDGFDHAILHTRQEVFYLSPCIILLMLKNIFRPRFFRLISGTRISGLLLMTYLYSCIEYIKPKIVITTTDNDFRFHWISRAYKGARFYAIQNGTRDDYGVHINLPALPHPAHLISMPDFICFGEYEKNLYLKYGHVIDRFHPVGSLLGGYYRSEICKKGTEKEFDICLVSEWEILNLSMEFYLPAKNGVALFYDFFSRYLDEYHEKDRLKVCVATRTGEKNECDYFKKKFGNRVKLIMQDRKNFTTYRAMDRSDVTVAFVTTAAREAFGWGNKVLFCNFSTDHIHDFPVSGVWSANRDDYSAFRDKLNRLRKMSAEEFAGLSREHRKVFMNYMEDMPAHKYVRKLMAEGLRCRAHDQSGLT